jgi:hypothetical protein
MDVQETAGYVNLSASAAARAGRGSLLGIFCASSSAATCKVWDNTAASGSIIANTFTLVGGVFYPLPFDFQTGCFVTITGTADITVAVKPGT